MSSACAERQLVVFRIFVLSTLQLLPHSGTTSATTAAGSTSTTASDRAECRVISALSVTPPCSSWRRQRSKKQQVSKTSTDISQEVKQDDILVETVAIHLPPAIVACAAERSRRFSTPILFVPTFDVTANTRHGSFACGAAHRSIARWNRTKQALRSHQGRSSRSVLYLHERAVTSVPEYHRTEETVTAWRRSPLLRA